MALTPQLKILVIRFSSIGDVVLTTPVIRCLKKQRPDVEVHYITKPEYKLLLSGNPYIDKLLLLKPDLGDTIRELRAENYDYIIDLHHNQRTFLIKLRLMVRSYSFNKLNFKKWLLTTFKINTLPKKHIVDRYMETLSVLGVKNDNEGLDFFIDAKDEVDIYTLPIEFRNGYIGWAIGAKQNTKKLPIEKIVAGINEMNMPIVLLGGKEDATSGEEIISKCPSKQVHNACGKYNLGQSASLVKQASAIITNDTGLMHIAAAFKKKIVSVWGNTVPAFGMYPYLPVNAKPATILEVQGLKCRPCSKLGYAKCPQGHFKCMNEIDVAKIVLSS
jgi:ADP-heptose:LPS heptosyltransferase